MFIRKDHEFAERDPRVKPEDCALALLVLGFIHKSVLRRSGGYVEVSEPDPIPNSVVKRLRADGTSS
jgi:hypothetical protein